jgi:hypothetical protein
VSRNPHDPWRLPTLGRFGAQLRDLENGAPPPSTIPRSRVSARAILLSGGGILAALACVLLILTSGRTAQARSVVNEAPAAAERSGTVRFRSALTITVDGHPRPGITEQGALDFASGAYATTVRFGNAGQVLERRSTGGLLYARERALHPGPRPGRIDWLATPLQPPIRGPFSSEGDAFTDPLSLFRALSGIRTRVSLVGRESLNGVPTTRYHMLTTLESFLRPSAGHIQNSVSYGGIRAALDVWIDAHGRPRRVQETFTGPSASGPTTMSTLVHFSGYGRAVSVVAPSRSLVGSARRIAPQNPLAAGPGSLLARRLFFQPVSR